jgi:hypothetical protein
LLAQAFGEAAAEQVLGEVRQHASLPTCALPPMSRQRWQNASSCERQTMQSKKRRGEAEEAAVPPEITVCAAVDLAPGDQRRHH